MSQPTVSIVTIVYNGIDTLNKTIQSINNQTYQNIEYIIIDGNSNDGTVELLKKNNSSISKWISEPDNGLYDAMNKGIKMATGDYIWFINSGDEITNPDTLTSLFEHHPISDIYYGDTIMIDSDGNEIGLRRLSPPEKLTWKDFRKGMLVSHQSFICSTQIAELYNLKYRFSADFEWCLLALKKAKTICNTHMVLSKFLDGGLTKNNISAGLKERFKIMVEHFGLFSTLNSHIILGIKLIWFIVINKRF